MVIKSDKSLSPFAAPSETRSKLRQALPQILAVSVKNVLLLGFGMTLGFPTILIPSLSGNNPEEPIALGQEAISWIGSINLICVPVGCLLSGALTQPLGRKRAMQLVNIPFLTAWLLFYFSTEVWQIFLALAITGVTGGLLEAPTLTYVAEITQPSLRGVLCSTSTVAIIAGILIQFLLGTFITWRQVALVSCTVPVLSFLTLFLVPESPYWLIAKKRFEDTRKSLAWLRGWLTLEEVDSEFQELSTQIQSREEHHTSWRLYTKKSFLWPYALVSFTFFLGHFSGMTTLQTYAIKIFSSINAPIDKYYATISLGAVEVLGCILSASLVHFLGKRIMNFFSLLACGTCFLIVATFAHLHGFLYLEENDGPSSWLPMCLLIATAFFTHSGIRILPWMLVGEVFSHQTRATATGIASGTSYIFSFAANKLFLGMVERLTLPGTFWMYGGLCVLGTVILYFALPETEGKTLFEITEHFAGNKHLDNKVWTKEEGAVVNRGYVHSTDGLNSESKF